MSFWFILLTVVTAWACLYLAHTISIDEELRSSDLVIEANTFLLFMALILAGKAYVETLHRAVESKELMVLLDQPIPIRKVVLGKFMGVLFSNLTVVAYGLVLVTALQIGSFHVRPYDPLSITVILANGMRWTGGVGITPFQIMDVILLSLIASCTGFIYSIVNSLNIRKRIGGIIGYSILLGAVAFIMREGNLLPVHQTGALAILMAMAFCALIPTSDHFLEAWVKQTSGKRALFFQKRSWGRLGWLEKVFDPRTSRLMRKEIIINVQKKEILGNIMAILGLSALLIWGWHRIESLEEMPDQVGDIAYPAIISIGIYLAAILQCGLIGLGSIGKEGRKFWILRSLPVHPENMFKAKALSILALSPLTILAVSIPLPVILGYDWSWMSFFVLLAIAFIMAFTGIGLLLGARYPNFNESMGGMPDVMSMYLTMLICLIIGGGMSVFAGYNMSESPMGGLLSLIIILEVGIIILIIGMRLGAWIYSRTEPKMV
jgi:hypothetical protein